MALSRLGEALTEFLRDFFEMENHGESDGPSNAMK